MTFFLVLVLTAAFSPFPAQAQSAEPAGQWKFSVLPYLWLPNVNGTLKYNIPQGAQGSPEVEAGPNDYLQNLQAMIMLSAEARKDKWSFFTDVIYLEFSDEESSVKTIDFGGSIVSSSANLTTKSSLRGTAWTLGAGYTLLKDADISLDIIGGLRYFDITVSTNWDLEFAVTGPGGVRTFPRTGGVSREMELWDGVIGVRGAMAIGSSGWSIPYYMDIGTGSSRLTYQMLVGVTYSFKWGGVTLAYRDLYYDQGDDKFLQDLRFSGPAIGVTFRF